MSVSIPYTFTGGPGNKARAGEVNANFQALAAKFTEGAGGIADGDVSSSAGIKGSKLSSVAGNRVTAAQLEDSAVDSRVLKIDATSGHALAAVATANHIADHIITDDKMLAGTLKKGSLSLSSVTFNVPGLAPGATYHLGTGLVSSSAFPLVVVAENAAEYWVHMRLSLNTGTGAYELVGSNTSDVSTSALFAVRVWYLAI